MYAPVGITAGTSSSTVEPAEHLDPDLFDGMHLKPDVRASLLSTLSGFLSARYMGVNEWLRAWIAGSGASYRWIGSGGDLDILLGIDGVAFRRANSYYLGFGDTDLAKQINDQMRTYLWPTTSRWRGRYTVTWYINPHSFDIRVIKPYAAYDLLGDGWTVPPTSDAPEVPEVWGLLEHTYRQRAITTVERYTQALTELTSAANPAHRRDAEVRFNDAVSASVALFDSVHDLRNQAFSASGDGYADFGNFLWQQGKAGGWVTALRQIKDYQRAVTAEKQAQTYGLELPDTDTLIRRAALQHRLTP